MDGLRALACLTVLLVHTWQVAPAGQAQFGAAWRLIEPIATIGLILFFTLSGFLLYRPFAAALIDGRPLPSISAYLRNRALRILPAYLCVLLVAWLLSALAQPGNQNAAGGFDSVHAAVLNVLLLQSYTPHTNLTGIPPAWSLSVEIVFYLVLPLLVLAAGMLIGRGSRRRRLIVVCAPAVVLLFLGLAGKVIDHRLLGFATHEATWGYVFQNSFLAKADLFAWGMIAAALTSYCAPATLRALPARAFALTGLGALALGDLANQSPLAALGCGLILLWVTVSFARSSVPRGPVRLLECRPVVFVGLASYSVYLLHWPVILWLGKHGLLVHGWPGVFVDVALVGGVTIALASLCYRFVELPAMRRKRSARAPRWATKMRERSALGRNVAGSIATSLFTQGGLLLSGVAGARILGVLDRGRSALLLLFASVLPLLATLGLSLALTYWIARDVRQTRRLISRVRAQVIWQAVILTIVHGCVLYGVFHSSPGSVQLSAAISLLASPAILLWIYALAVLQGTQDFRALNLCRLIFPPLNALLLMAMLLTGTGDLVLVTTVWVSLYVLSALITLAVARRTVRALAPEGDGVGALGDDGVAAPAGDSVAALPSNREMLVFGMKALLGSASPLTQFQLDQTIVGVFISQAALGIYVVGVAFTNLPRFIAQSIGLVAYPHVAAVTGERERRRATLKFLGLTLVLCGATVALTELAIPFLVPLLFGRAFSSAVAVARILLISALLFCLTRVLSDCARGAGRPALGTVAEVVSLGSLFPFVVLLSASGARGVAVALALAAAAGVATILVALLAAPSTSVAREPVAVVSEP